MDWLDLDSDDFATLLRELATRRIPVDPTLITYHTKFFGDGPRWIDHPDLRLVPEIAAWWRSSGGYVADWTPEDPARARGLWPKVGEMIRRYHEAGVRRVWLRAYQPDTAAKAATTTAASQYPRHASPGSSRIGPRATNMAAMRMPHPTTAAAAQERPRQSPSAASPATTPVSTWVRSRTGGSGCSPRAAWMSWITSATAKRAKIPLNTRNPTI
jgi:hypothetical protein